MKRLLLTIGIFLLLIGGVILGWKMGWWKLETELKNPISDIKKNKKIEKNTGYLAQYNFENLKKRENKPLI
jgi:hypothetical protein